MPLSKVSINVPNAGFGTRKLHNSIVLLKAGQAVCWKLGGGRWNMWIWNCRRGSVEEKRVAAVVQRESLHEGGFEYMFETIHFTGSFPYLFANFPLASALGRGLGNFLGKQFALFSLYYFVFVLNLLIFKFISETFCFYCQQINKKYNST